MSAQASAALSVDASLNLCIEGHALSSPMWIKGVLQLPDDLWASYEKVLIENNVLDSCKKGISVGGTVGGPTLSDTVDHFVYRFANSASRVCYIIADPISDCTQLSNDIRLSFFDGEVRILDLAGGTGAATSALLSSMVELRRSGTIPTLPLNVSIIAADISESALNIYRDVLESLSDNLDESGIVVSLETRTWDATDLSQTSALCDNYLAANRAGEVFVIVSNLSGIGKAQLELVSRSFTHVTERISNMSSTFAWIEPHAPSGLKFIERVADRIFRLGHWFTNRTPETTKFSYKWFHKLQHNNQTITSGLTIKLYRRIKV